MIQLAIGLVAGILSGLFGIGGGVVIVPALVLVMRMAPQTAVGTSLAALLLPVGALGAYQYWRHGATDPRSAAFIACGLIAGAWLGSLAGLALPPRLVQRAFAVFLVLVAGQMWWKA
jgi:uncharacterized membrane protein YfcA